MQIPENPAATADVSDDAIVEAFCRFMEESPGVDAGEVKATANDGVLTLDGAVDAAPERWRAVEIAETTPGVKRVVDNLTVLNYVPMEDEELKNAVMNALSRDAFVESLPNLEVYVERGTVRLEGTSKTWHERRAIADAVWWTPGVLNVEVMIHPTEEPQDYAEDRTAHHNEDSL